MVRFWTPFPPPPLLSSGPCAPLASLLVLGAYAVSSVLVLCVYVPYGRKGAVAVALPLWGVSSLPPNPRFLVCCAPEELFARLARNRYEVFFMAPGLCGLSQAGIYDGDALKARVRALQVRSAFSGRSSLRR